MSLQWIAKNLSLGGLVSNAGSGIGSVTKAAAKGVGATAGLLIQNQEKKQSFKDACDSAGQSMDGAVTDFGAAVGGGINYGMQKVGEVSGSVSGSVAKRMGASDENVIIAQKIGAIVGTAAVGMAAGTGIADAAVAASAATGTAGAAATASGLAAIGGGSIAAGGGGMAAGQAVVSGIVTAGTVSGAASAKSEK